MEEDNEELEWDFFNHLPEELILKVLSYLSPYTDTKTAKLVNRRWNRLISSIERHNDRVFHEAIRTSNIMWQIHKLRSYDITDTLVPGTHRKGAVRTKVKRQNKNVPSPRFSHAAVIMRQYLYIFSGSNSEYASGSTYNDIYRLDLSSHTWERVQANGLHPAPRECCTLVGYSTSKLSSPIPPPHINDKGLLIMYGGWCQPPLDNRIRVDARFFEDTQIFHLNDLRWERLKIASPPPARAGHSASIVGDKMIIFGGSQRSDRLNDIWVFDINTLTWRHQYIRGTKPRERFGHSQFTLNEKAMIVLGGCGGPNELFADAWVLDVQTWNWIQIKIEGAIYEPPELWCHASVLVHQDIIVFSEEKKCPHCACPIQNYKVSEFKPDANAATCSCGRRKPEDMISLYDNHLQMYTLDCSSLFTNSKCRWLPCQYLAPAPITRKLFTASLGLNEILLFGGLSNLYRNESPRSDDCTIAVRAKPSPS